MTSEQRLHQEQPLYEQTYLTLRSAILSGEIKLGDRLIETQLAQKLQVSRTPVREALRRLQQESLIKAESNGGLSVAEISLHSAVKLYECRIALEQLSVAGACQYATAEQLQAIEQTVIYSELACQDNLKLVSTNLLDLNCRFHRLIAQSSRNPWVVFLLEQISNQVTLLRIQTLQQRLEVEEIHREHRDIYEAIARRDSQAAVEQVTEHLLASQQRIVQLFDHKHHSSDKREEDQQHQAVKCPSCGASQVSKNGRRKGKQNYLCKQCGRQFFDSYSSLGYPPETRQECLKLYLEGKSFREVERLTGVSHNTVIRWANKAGLSSAKE